MTLLDRIENHLKDHHISATRFGRRAVGDPRFVLDLRMGRRPRRRTRERLGAYLCQAESGVEETSVTKVGCRSASPEAPRNAGRLPAKAAPRPPRRTG